MVQGKRSEGTVTPQITLRLPGDPIHHLDCLDWAYADSRFPRQHHGVRAARNSE